MSKLEQLIEELCPDGVEYVKLGEVGRVAMCKRIMKAETSADGEVPFYKIGTFGKTANAYISFETYEKYKCNYSFPNKGDILISAAGTIGRTVIYDGKPAYYQDSNIVWLEHDETRVINKYLYYCYQLSPWHVSSGGTIARLYNDNISKAKIPLPPLPVQREIVRILDNFTELTVELTTELTAELTARKKQYEYYRNELLTFGDDVPRIILSSICDIYDGTHQTPTYTTEGVRFASVENIGAPYDTKKYISVHDYETKYKIKPQLNDVLMTRIGSIGTCSVIDRDESLAYYVSLALLRPNQSELNSRFIKHYIESVHGRRELRRRTLINAVPIKINMGDIGRIAISLPSLSEQTRIAAILDKYDALTKDITNGLPAEIEARRKQYEYYRDKLLSFKEVGA